MRAWAVIVAGGSGTRMGADIPKQLLVLDGKTILERTLTPFVECTDIEGIVVAAAVSSFDAISESIRDCELPDEKITVVKGGAERQQSVLNALKAIPDGVDIVLIHDAVRPFITRKLIFDCAHSAAQNGAMTVMRPLKETVKVVKGDVVVSTPDRSELWITQTPQAFRYDLIMEAHSRAIEDGFFGTDDCMLVERIGHPVHIIEGDDTNIKITTPADLQTAGAILTYFQKGDM